MLIIMNEQNNSNLRPSNRVVIIGAGMVGATSAYAILIEDIAQEILLIDTHTELAEAQVLDLEDAASFSQGTGIINGNYSDLKDGDIVVVTAGAAQKEGQSRSELLQINAGILNSIIEQLNATGKGLFVLLVTNPVDVLTYLAVKKLNQPRSRIFGSGTTLDTARLKAAISKITEINAHNVHAFILGEHGDTSFPVLSQATVGGVKVVNFPGIDQAKLDNLAGTVRERAYQIIAGKKSTYYGIGAAVARICKAIINDENRVFTLSVFLDGQYGVQDVCVGIPVQVSSEGYAHIGEIHLNEQEMQQFQQSAQAIKANINQLEI
jgi:L-lactate dehydrogenase